MYYSCALCLTFFQSCYGLHGLPGFWFWGMSFFFGFGDGALELGVVCFSVNIVYNSIVKCYKMHEILSINSMVLDTTM